MAVPTLITELSTVAGDNSPAGTENVLPNLDNYIRAHASFIKQTYDDALSKASGGTVAGAVTFSAAVTLSNGATGNITGNATTATRLQTARTIALSGGVTGTATSFNGSSNITIPVTALDSSLLDTLPGTIGAAGSVTIGGLVLKWGISGSVDADGSLAVSFPAAFPTAIYSVVLTPNTSTGPSGSGAERYTMATTSVSTSGFTIFNDSGVAMPAYWIAIGS